MDPLRVLRACEGRWTGKNRFHDPQTGVPEQSPGTAIVAAVLGGRFVRLDYTWAYQKTPQEGSLLIGHDAGSGSFRAAASG